MKTVTIRNLVIGEGVPKICVPIVGKTISEIKAQAEQAASVSPDIVEWRVDHFTEILDSVCTADACAAIREILPEIPLLFTFRTHNEGGAMKISQAAYIDILQNAVCNLPIDLVDIELFNGDDVVRELIRLCHQHGIFVIGSNHDFEKTPPSEEMLIRLNKMESLGCDIAKLAVMPQTPSDVVRLLEVTDQFHTRTDIPVVTMSMARLGLISRLCGSLTGSAITFGSAGHASAPGQIPVEQLREILEIL